MVRWTRLVVAHRRAVLALWFVLLVAGFAGWLNVGKLLTNRFSVPGSDSERGLQVLRSRFHERGDGTFTLVVRSGTARVDLAAVQAAAERAARAVPGGEPNIPAVARPGVAVVPIEKPSVGGGGETIP